MSWRKTMTGLVMVGAVGALLYVGYRHLSSPQGCDLCGRERHSHIEATVLLQDGRRVETCCARCALHFNLGKPDKVARMIVEDAITGVLVEAANAVYLEGSAAEGCHPKAETGPREPGIAYELRFDRCLPSLIAFRTEADAREFQKEYGGRLLSFTQALESVRHR
jgi:hypothetical protein